MAAPSYTEDLTDITLAETTTGWTALGGGASGLGVGPDFAMEGTNCVDKQVTTSEKGQIYNNGAAITPGANTHFFIWTFLATPGLANTLANRGLAMILGTGTTAYVAFHVEGSDTYGAAGRVGKCYPVRYRTDANTGSVPYRTVTGSPTANPQYFGATANITGSVKSANLGVDAIRYGTGIYITDGESGTPATFSGAATANDAITARWGILSAIAGSNYELQGRFVVGQSNTYTPTLAYFADSNKNILLVDTPHSLADFTQVIVDHASTVFNLTNITIEAAGTNNKGKLVFNNASTVATLTGCNFVKMGEHTLNAGVTTVGCSWRECGKVTLQGATVSGAVIAGSTGTAAMLAASPAGAAAISGSDFTSAGTGHAIEVTGTAANMTLTDVVFSGYAASNGSTGNEAVFINIASGSMNLTIDGGTTPSVRTAGATVTVISGAVTVIAKAVTEAGTAIASARVHLEAAAGGPFPSGASVTIANSGTTATVTHAAHGLATNDKVVIRGASHDANNGVFSITVTGVGTYTYTMGSTPGSSPTGTITSGFVVLNGETNGSGEISMSRVFPSAQPVIGRIRKASAPPFYKQAALTGTVSSSAGGTFTGVMISDD